MADTKISALTALTTPADEDLLAIVDDPSGTPITKKITRGNLLGTVKNIFTPTLQFATNGDLAVTYAVQQGHYIYDPRTGLVIIPWLRVQTSAFTHSTAVGQLQVAGLPFAALANTFTPGGLSFAGITKAGYTQFTARANGGQSFATILASGSGVPITASSVVAVADVPSGGTVDIRCSFQYLTA